MKMLTVLMAAGLVSCVAFGVETAEQNRKSYVIKETDYSINITDKSAVVGVKIEGSIFDKSEEPIFLLDNKSVISEINKITGGTLISGKGNSGFFLMPTAKKNSFLVHLTFLLEVQEDNKSKFVEFAISESIRNRLKVTLPLDYELLDSPGIADEKGVYHFPINSLMILRFKNKATVSTASIVDTDSFSNITLQSKRAIVSTHFTTARSFSDGVMVVVPDGMNFLNSSLKSSWLSRENGIGYRVKIPQAETRDFVMQFSVEDIGLTNFSFKLPYIKGNSGSDGNFVFKEPDDAQITIKAKGLKYIPAKRMPSSLRNKVKVEHDFMHVPADESVNIQIKRYKSISQQTVVLDTQYFFTTFEENGNVLSVIIMDLPSDVGNRLKMKAVPDAEIWSLTVDGVKKRVYSSDNDTWIIPLEPRKTSHIELALLRKGEKLGLHGKLETTLPETGLQSLNVRVGIALPARVELLSLEGSVNPDNGSRWKAPVEFIGRPYYFSRSFYKGDGIKLSLSYKEPVKHR